MKTTDNLKTYEAARTVPKEAQREIKAGRLKGFTDINPMWRIKRLTEMFGPCGVGWWYEITDKRMVTDEMTSQVAAFVDVLLFYVDPDTGTPSNGIPGTGGSSFVSQERSGPYMSDECFKMALTDALSVACKSLGIGADVYWQGDRSKYSSVRETSPAPPPIICERCGTVVKDYTDLNGKRVSAAKWATGTKEKFGAVLCTACMAKAKAGI